MYTVLYYKDGQYWGRSTHDTLPGAEAAIAKFHEENPGDSYFAFIAQCRPKTFQLFKMQPLVKNKIAKFRQYLDYFERHYDNVQRAWALLNEKCDNNRFRFMYDDFVWNTIDAEVKAHDDSKLSASEFTQYRNYWFPADYEEKDEAAYLSAWEHHKEHNEHHWQTWTAKHATNPYADAFVVMNVVDWVAMGFEFGDTARDYYEKNKAEINLPDWAVKLMYEIFDCIYPERKMPFTAQVGE